MIQNNVQPVHQCLPALEVNQKLARLFGMRALVSMVKNIPVFTCFHLIETFDGRLSATPATIWKPTLTT